MKKINVISAIITAFIGFALPALAQTTAPMDEASPSSQPDFDTIKENVKKRLQEVVQDKVLGENNKEKLAIIGILKSRAGNTLTIESEKSVKLASISGQTEVARVPTGSPLTIDDVALDDYVAVLGYAGSDDVLDTRKIILHRTEPAKTAYTQGFGTITSYDPKSYQLEITHPVNQSTSTYIVSRKAVIKQAYLNDVYTELPRNKPLPEGAFVLIAYTPAQEKDDDAVAYQILIKTNPLVEAPEQDAE